MRHDQAFISIPHMIRASAQTFGDRVAITDDEVVLDYRQLETAMFDAARAMIALGIEPGDRVALCGPNSAAWIRAALGLQAAGAVLIPVNTRFKGEEIGHLLTKSDASAFITVGTFLGNDYVGMVRSAVPEARAMARIIILDDQVVEGTVTFADAVTRGVAEVDDASVIARIDAITSSDLSDIMFTSGTTGQPKGVMLTHAQTLRAYGNMGEILGITQEDCILVIPPFFHSFGYKAGWLMGLMFGLNVVPQRTFAGEEVLEKIEKLKVSCVFGPPTIFVDVMNHPRRPSADLSSLRVTVVSAASIPVSLIKKLEDGLGFDMVLTAYGLTEACAIVSICRPTDDYEHIANTAGRPFDDVEVKSVDDAGHDLPAGEEGELWVRGYNVMASYWDEPEQTAEALTPDGWLRTGDIGIVDAEGYVKVTDRKKDMFIVGGFNAYPAEIENALSRFDKIQFVAVIGVPDERMGEVGEAWVVPMPGVDLDAQEVIAYAREHVANFKVPRQVHIVSDLPRNASMKVLKHVLRDQVASPSA